MSVGELERLVRTAVIYSRFREKLLNGSRAQMLDEFELTAEEREFLLGIRAETIQEFAACLMQWLKERGWRELSSFLLIADSWPEPSTAVYIGTRMGDLGSCVIDG